MSLKNDWQNGDTFTPAAANDMANAVNAYGTSTAKNVKDYGVTGNGTTDDTSAIHAARDAAAAGGKLFFPAGTYLVSGLTASLANQTWELAEGATIKMKTNGSKILNITGSGVTVTGGIFDGSNGTTHSSSQDGLVINASDVFVENVTVQNCPNYGIVSYSQNNVSIRRCTITNTYNSAIACFNYVTAPSTISNISLTDNFVNNSSGPDTAQGIAVRGNTTTQRINHVLVSGNTVILPYNQTSQTASIAIHTCTDYVCSNNVTIGGYLGITNPNSINGVISHNMVRGFSTAGIELPGNTDGVSITGNVLDPDGTSASIGIWTSQGNFNNVSISGNSIKNFSSGVTAYAIAFSSNTVLNRATVTGNVFTSACTSFKGIYCNGSSTISNLTVAGNTIDGTTSTTSRGIEFLGNVTGVNVSGNQFSNLTTAAVYLVASAAVTLDYIKLLGNQFVNCGGTLINSSGGSSVVGSNVYTELVPSATAATATTLAQRDSNANLVADAFIPSLATTATAAGTTTLTVGSAETQLFTGTSTQTCVLPTTGVAAGQRFTIVNTSSGAVTVNASAGSTVTTVAASSTAVVTALQATPTAATHWTKTVSSVNGYNGNVTLAKSDVGLGNVDNTSNATERAATAALTNKDLTSGTNTFPTFNQNTIGTAANVTGTVALANGGTGQTTAAAAITALTGSQTSGRYLRSDGTNATLAAIQAADVPTLNQNTTGTAGNGIPTGGTANQTLTKIDGTNYNTQWVDTLPATIWPGGASGEYIVFGGATVNTAQVEGRLVLTPYWAPKSFSISRIALNVATAGSSGSVIRIGAYNDDNGIPGTLIFDAGTVDSTTTGTKEITTTQTLPAGRFWLAAVVQGAASTLAVISATNSSSAWNTNAMLVTTSGYLDSVYFSMIKASVSGSLPSPAFSTRSSAGSHTIGYSFRVRLS